jgi:hypothetical protein
MAIKFAEKNITSNLELLRERFPNYQPDLAGNHLFLADCMEVMAMMKKNSVKAAFQFASLDKPRHDGLHIYRSTAKHYFICRLFERLFLFCLRNKHKIKSV